MLARNGRETCKKFIDGFAGLKIVKQRLHGDSCPVEHGAAPMMSGLIETMGCFMSTDYTFPL